MRKQSQRTRRARLLVQSGHMQRPSLQNNAQRANPGQPNVLPVRSWQLALFRRFIARRRLKAQFRAVRLLFAERLPPAHTDGLIFYLNHPSWWDPLLSMVLAQRFIPGRNFYAPMEARQLQRYGVLRRLGLFPVEAETLRGAAQFLRSAEAVLRQGYVLGLTPQGAMIDARERPPAFKPGLGALIARMERAGLQVTAVPVALEYTFWNQRLPEALVAVGDPIVSGAGHSASEWTALLQQRLGTAQEELAEHARTRHEGAFETLLTGERGEAGVYGLWHWVRSGGRSDHLPDSGKQS